jgi:hypothetical protein
MEESQQLEDGGSPQSPLDTVTQTVFALQEQIMHMQERQEEVLKAMRDGGMMAM